MPDLDVRDRRDIAEKQGPSENLALLYQGLLTGIVRLQSRRQYIAEAEPFRRRTKAALQEVERDAVAAGYDAHDVRDTHFAVVAFLDAVVLNSNDPVRNEWERKTLQEELFGKSEAGVVFFDKLENFRSRRDSSHLADILEVYLLCLLLGFEGRYSGGLRAELHSISEMLRRRIEGIRGRSRHISPTGQLPEPATAAVASPRSPPGRRYRVIAAAAILITLLCFLIFKLELISSVEQARNRFF